jgi:hypothetical protein
MECIPRAITLLRRSALLVAAKARRQPAKSQRGFSVQTGVMELVTRGNEEPIANVGFVIRADAVAVIDPVGRVREI